MLAALLQDEIAALWELQGLLFQEYAALKARNLSILEQVTGAKRFCTDRLQGLAQGRVAYLLQQGLSADAAGMEASITSSEPQDRLQLEALWTDLETVTAQVQQQNQLNGAIIAAHRGHIERALSILQGRDPQACLYGQAAQTSFGSRSRSLAKV
jgi:flagellar biosynthesis/type III secretory pathway chaperone